MDYPLVNPRMKWHKRRAKFICFFLGHDIHACDHDWKTTCHVKSRSNWRCVRKCGAIADTFQAKEELVEGNRNRRIMFCLILASTLILILVWLAKEV